MELVGRLYGQFHHFCDLFDAVAIMIFEQKHLTFSRLQTQHASAQSPGVPRWGGEAFFKGFLLVPFISVVDIDTFA